MSSHYCRHCKSMHDANRVCGCPGSVTEEENRLALLRSIIKKPELDPDVAITVYEPIVCAAKALRSAQKQYMANRGDDAIGALVAKRAAELDDALSALESPHANNPQ